MVDIVDTCEWCKSPELWNGQVVHVADEFMPYFLRALNEGLKADGRDVRAEVFRNEDSSPRHIEIRFVEHFDD